MKKPNEIKENLETYIDELLVFITESTPRGG